MLDTNISNDCTSISTIGTLQLLANHAQHASNFESTIKAPVKQSSKPNTNSNKTDDSQSNLIREFYSNFVKPWEQLASLVKECESKELEMCFTKAFQLCQQNVQKFAELAQATRPIQQDDSIAARVRSMTASLHVVQVARLQKELQACEALLEQERQKNESLMKRLST